MCPLCITTAALSAAGATAGAGVIAAAASNWRTLRRWLCGYSRRRRFPAANLFRKSRAGAPKFHREEVAIPASERDPFILG
jgi:hypothetical protein